MELKEIREQITQKFMAESAVRKLYGFGVGVKFDDYFPEVSVERVLVNAFSFGVWILNQLFEAHRTDIRDYVSRMKPHHLRWYVSKAKMYQHAFKLPTDSNGYVCSDVYADSTSEMALAAQIVKYAVAHELVLDGNILVRIKAAKYTSNSNKQPTRLSDSELAGLKSYFSQVKDAGVPLAIISNEADKVTLEVVVHYDPMILTLDGNKLKNSNDVDVIRNAVLAVAESLPFNGDLKKSALIDAINAIDGVEVADVTNMQIRAYNSEYSQVVGYCTPESGYFELEALTLTAKPYTNGSEI